MPYFSKGEIKSKLIILYILKCVEIDLSRMQLYRIVFDTEAMTYFEFQNALYELEDSRCIALVPRAFGQSYRITAKGIRAFESLEKTIEESILEKIDQYVKQNKQAMISEVKYPIVEEQLPDGTYKVHMSVQENTGPVFELVMNLSSREMIEPMKKKWEEASTSLYKQIINVLTKE